MKPYTRTFVVMLVATVLAAGFAGWAGVQFGMRDSRPADLHQIIHAQLSLRPDQDRKIASLEESFAAKRRQYEAEMRAANGELAAAIAREQKYGVAAQRAIERFHRAMVALQEETVRHVLAMRSVLTPDQAARFDAIIAKHLVS